MKHDYIQQLSANLGATLGERLPGFGGWLNARVAAITPKGDIQLDFTVRSEMLNPMGALHGGAIAAIVDEVLGFQLFLKAAEDTAYVSMTMNIDFLRAAQEGEVIRAVPEVVRIGKRTANVRCTLYNSAQQAIAQGVSNFMRVV